MKLTTAEVSQLHFPRTEWKWLRAAVRLETPESSPDAFLWAAEVSGKLWAWHPRGADVNADGAKTSRVLVLTTDGSEFEAHGLFLKTTFAAAPAHDTEWVAALKTLTSRFKYDAATSGLPRHWVAALEACGLSANLGALATHSKFVFLNDTELKLAFERRWDLAALELLDTVNSSLRTPLVEAIRKWNISASNAKEAISHALILARKMGEKSALTVLGGAYGNGEEFRMALFRTAQPELAKLSDERIEALRDLNIPPRTSVYGDPSFENDMLKITHNPRRLADFQMFREWVLADETFEKLQALLEIYNQLR